jgi:hypothetical protein
LAKLDNKTNKALLKWEALMRDREGENMEKSNLGRKKSEVNLFSYSFIIWRSLFQGKVKKKTFEK